MGNQVAYNPGDSLQSRFLSALALGETGNVPNAYTIGVGGTDLSGAITHDGFGFPSWSGLGNSHAAGAYQFQPGTWKEVASKYNLDWTKPADQNAGAWYYAQDVYKRKTGGNLYDALKLGDYASVQTALRDAWPSVVGNAAAPKGLAANLAGGKGAAISSQTPRGIGSVPSAEPLGILGSIENWFVRGGLIFAGIVLILVALWFLMQRSGLSNSAKFAK